MKHKIGDNYQEFIDDTLEYFKCNPVE